MLWRILVILFVGTGWLVLETVVVGFLPARFPSPDVILVLVILFGFRYSRSFGGPLAFLLGLVQDVLSGGIVGLNALSKTVVFALTASMSGRFYFPNLFAKVAMVLLGGAVDVVLLTVVQAIARSIHVSMFVSIQQLMLQILFSGLLAPLIIVVTTKLLNVVERETEVTYQHGSKESRARRT